MILTLKLEKQENDLFKQATMPGFLNNNLYQNGCGYYLHTGETIDEDDSSLTIQVSVMGNLDEMEKKEIFPEGKAFMCGGKFSSMVTIIKNDREKEWTFEYTHGLESLYKKWLRQRNERNNVV